MSQERLGRDVSGAVDFSLPAPISCEDALLAPAAVVSITAPLNFNRAFFSYSPGTNVWVTLDGTAPVVPVSTGSSTQELNPAIRQLNANVAQTIKLISDTAAYVSIRFDLGT